MWRAASRADSVRSCRDSAEESALRFSMRQRRRRFYRTWRYCDHLVRHSCVLHRWPVHSESSFVRRWIKIPCAYAIRICETLYIRAGRVMYRMCNTCLASNGIIIHYPSLQDESVTFDFIYQINSMSMCIQNAGQKYWHVGVLATIK